MVLNKEEVQQMIQIILEWFSRKASWRHYIANILI
jgi:hypothetical protein